MFKKNPLNQAHRRWPGGALVMGAVPAGTRPAGRNHGVVDQAGWRPKVRCRQTLTRTDIEHTPGQTTEQSR